MMRKSDHLKLVYVDEKGYMFLCEDPVWKYLYKVTASTASVYWEGNEHFLKCLVKVRNSTRDSPLGGSLAKWL